jgi:FMN phosphatase YigB (HAD superfamily)
MISTVIFDLNNTLVGMRFDDPGKRYEQQLGVSQENFFRVAFAHWQDYEVGKFGQAAFFNYILTDLGISQSHSSIALQLFLDDFYLIEGMDEILDALYGKYRLLLLAGDGDGLLQRKLDKFNLTRYFSRVYCTCFEGLHKNNPQIYRNVLAKEQVNPSLGLFIDDRPDFIRSAKEVGVNVILFKNSAQLRKDLLEYAI